MTTEETLVILEELTEHYANLTQEEEEELVKNLNLWFDEYFETLDKK